MELYDIAILSAGLILFVALIAALGYLLCKKKKTFEDPELKEVIIHRPETRPTNNKGMDVLDRLMIENAMLQKVNTHLAAYIITIKKNKSEENNLQQVIVHQTD